MLQIGCCGPSYTNGIEICGTKGTIVDDTFGMDLPPVIRYTLASEIRPEDIGNRKAMDAARYVKEWIVLAAKDLPEAPDDHIRYFVRMLAEDIPNEMVGIDPRSNHGVGLETAVDMVEIADAFYRSARSGRVENI